MLDQPQFGFAIVSPNPGYSLPDYNNDYQTATNQEQEVLTAQ
jgi:hypothetical protein